jgi:DNA mismatch repair protein MutL
VRARARARARFFSLSLLFFLFFPKRGSLEEEVPMKIRVLSEQTINQIAAGEVVENPASVVKELVENACDAGAREVVIEIEGGGLQRIAVSDNGSGMSPDDAILCLERYATSKIRSFEDVLDLQTMGFRGEAIASIASISKFTLMTALEGEVGTRVFVDGGRVISAEPCARTRGTTIDVKALFYNVPARKKFQKSETACAQEVSKMVTVLSLAYPSVSFTLMSQGERVLFAPASQGADPIAERATYVLGENYVTSTSSIAIDENHFQVKGLIGSPAHSRPQRTGQYLFINQRPVQSPLISYAVKDAYGTRLQEGRHPIYLLHIQIPADLIDINVHPQKKEVRFREEKKIKEQIQRAVQSAFLKKEGMTPLSCVPFSFRETPAFSDYVPQAQSFVFAEEKPLFQDPIVAIGVHGTTLFLDGASVAKRTGFGGEGVVIVDLLAANARLISDTFAREKKLQQQELLIPVTCEFSLVDAKQLAGRLAEIENLGFSIRPLGTTGFIVDALPVFMDPEEVKDALTAMLAEEPSSTSIFSCFAAARKKRFVLQEALAVFEKLILSPGFEHCPQGKPTMVHLNGSEIGKLFKKPSHAGARSS